MAFSYLRAARRCARAVSFGLASLLTLSLMPRAARAAVDTFGKGSGRDGDHVVAMGATETVNIYSAVTSAVAVGDVSLTVRDATGFASGALVLIWQTTGTSSFSSGPTAATLDLSATPTGTFELARIESVLGNQLTLTDPVMQAYAATGAQVVRVPEWNNVTISPLATVAAKPWDGASGGIVVFFATGSVVNAGRISADAAGFRGGLAINAPASLGCPTTTYDGAPLTGYARKGEGIDPSRYSPSGVLSVGPLTGGRGAVVNGGGGGNCHNSGGGGGGHGGAGGQGGFTWPGSSDLGGSRDNGGYGGAGLWYIPTDHWLLGGGGGAGEENNADGTSGGAGGGVIALRVGSLFGGEMSADGATAGTALSLGGSSDGSGGGGAGGLISVRVAGALSCASLHAVGGNGGGGGPDCGPKIGGGTVCEADGTGGGGGGGVVYLQATSIACTPDVSAGLAGTQASASWSGGLTRGATPTSKTAAPNIGRVVLSTDGPFCTTNAECSGTTPICGPSGTCRACSVADEGTGCTGATPVCGRSGACVECTARNTSACGSSRPFCDASKSQCTRCTGDAGDATASFACGASSPLCIASGSGAGACTKCLSNADCSGHSAGPICDTVSGACGNACFSDSDCPATNWCTAISGGVGSCVPRAANGAALPDGTGGTVRCDVFAGMRVCSSGVCDTSDDKCGYARGSGPCSVDAECRTGKCNPGTKTCADCASRADCSATQYCDVGGGCADLKAGGVSCSAAEQCTSGMCSAGVCGAGSVGSSDAGDAGTAAETSDAADPGEAGDAVGSAEAGDAGTEAGTAVSDGGSDAATGEDTGAASDAETVTDAGGATSTDAAPEGASDGAPPPATSLDSGAIATDARGTPSTTTPPAATAPSDGGSTSGGIQCSLGTPNAPLGAFAPLVMALGALAASRRRRRG